MSNTADELWSQWVNPSDVLSLLLLIGGDIIQKAIAQLVGCSIKPFGRCRLRVGITPVAFSFGWVAYGFNNLLSVIGEKRLMPTSDGASIVINCSNAFTRTNRSWILNRLLRDHETNHAVNSSSSYGSILSSTLSNGPAESIRIDIFELGLPSEPSLDTVWWLGWITIVLQIAIALPAWIIFGDWGVMMIVLCGNLLALITSALPQWSQEKWAGRTLDSENVFCLTRGNGHLHVMVFICCKGSWNLETLATATSTPRPETPIISLVLAILWMCILISVAGLKERSWFLIGIGGIGMLQNVYAAGKARDPSTADFHLTKFSRMPTIIGKRRKVRDDLDSNADLIEAEAELSELSEWQENFHLKKDPEEHQMPKWLDSMQSRDGAPAWLEALRNDDEIANVNGALMELEKWVPTAGLAMVQVFFPGGLQYQKEAIRDNMHKKFWSRAYHTRKIRKGAERARREKEVGLQGGESNNLQRADALSPSQV
jgi:hypothetical protein